MLRFTIQRALTSLFTLLGASVVVFTGIRIVPGDPISIELLTAGVSNPQLVEQFRIEYGLNQALPIQYLDWIKQVLVGNLGRSVLNGQPVIAIIGQRLPASLLLAAAAALLALIGGVLWGVAAAYLKGVVGRTLRGLTVIFFTIPPFSLGIALAFIFAVTLMILPASGIETPLSNGGVGDLALHLVLPAITLACGPAAITSRITYAAIDELRTEDFVRTARAAGIPPARIALRHTLPNALLPVVTNSGILVAHMLTTAVFVEEVFAWPGIGTMLVNAVLNRDYPVLEAGALLITAIFVVLNLLVDVLYGLLDPRISIRGRSA